MHTSGRPARPRASRIVSFLKVGANVLASSVARQVADQLRQQWHCTEVVLRPHNRYIPFDVPAAIILKEALAHGPQWKALAIDCRFVVPGTIEPLADAMSANRTLTSFTAHLAPSRRLGHNSDACARLARSLLSDSSPVTTLRLSGLNADDGGIAFIDTLVTSLPSARALRELHLPRCSISAGQAVALVHAARETKLEVLGLNDNPITFEGVSAIAEFLAQTTSLRALSLNTHFIGAETDTAVAQIAGALKTNTSLERLSLASWRCDRKADAAMAEALGANTTLRDLGWSMNLSFASIATALETNSTLTRLDVRDISPSAGAQALASALKVNTGLRTLLLGTSVYGESAIALAESLGENRTLENLDLTDGIGNDPPTINRFFQTLARNKSLTRISVAHVHMDLENIRTIAQYLEGDLFALQALDLSYCAIDDEAAKVLAKALRANSSLRYLALIGNGIRDEGRAALSIAARARQSIMIDWRVTVRSPFDGIDSTPVSRPAIREIMANVTPLPPVLTKVVADYADDHARRYDGLLFPSGGPARWEEHERNAQAQERKSA